MLRFCTVSAVPAARPFISSSEGCLRMPFSALALYAQAAQPAAGAGELSTNTDIIHLVTQESLVGIAVLLILLIFSAVSWGVVLNKMWVFRRAESQTATFLSV